MSRFLKAGLWVGLLLVLMAAAAGTRPAAVSLAATQAATLLPTANATSSAVTVFPTSAATADSSAIGREDFQIDLGDFKTAAQLTYPIGATGPFTTVILVHGSTAADMDFDVSDFAGGTLSHIFKDIAEYLAQHSIATVRYNKHYVSGRGKVDQAKFATLTLKQMYADVESVYKAISVNPKVDTKRIILYGWSEGSPTAALFAAKHSEVAGLVLQGSVSGSFAETFYAQITDGLLPYLKQTVDTDKDGQITTKELGGALQSKIGGVTVKGGLFYLLSADASFFNLKFDPAIDTDKDGKLSIDQEIAPYFKDAFAHFDTAFGKFFPTYTSDQQLAFITDSVKAIKQPVLILHGENDANTSVRNARAVDQALADAGNSSHTLIAYPGLGHSLGKAASIQDDNFAPIDPKPLADLASWLNAHFGAAK